MPSQNGFRIFGEVLGCEESYLDVDVSGIDEEGDIYLRESVTDGEEWEFTAKEFAALHDDLLLVGADNIPFPTHQIWTDLENVGLTRAEIDINNFVDDHLRKSQTHLFKAIIEAGR